jgi:hypothetical protein
MTVRGMAVVAGIIAMEKLRARSYWLSQLSGGVFLGRESTPFWIQSGDLGTKFHIHETRANSGFSPLFAIEKMLCVFAQSAFI